MTARLTVLDVISRSAEFLAGKGIETGRLDAELLIAHCMGLDRMALYLQFDRPLDEQQLAEMRKAVGRRAKREPLQYITGQAAFHDLVLKVDRRVLIPRPETELLVEHAKGSLSPMDEAYRILDLGTGSGAIGLALAFAFPLAEVVAVDKDEGALELAKENSYHCGLQNRVRFLRSNWFEGIGEEEQFDLIVANPPYLTEEELQSAEPEVRNYEPTGALVAGDEGRADLETIIRGAYPRLKDGCSLWLETGIAQREALLRLCREVGYQRSECLQDLTKRDRFLHAER